MTRILIVDDTAELQTLYSRAAKAAGREIEQAESAKAATRMIEESDFDIVVTDLRMETKFAGIDVLKAAKEKDPFSQVIVATVFGTPEISAQVMDLGAFDYLPRNAAGTDFLAMLKSKINLAIQHRQALLAANAHHPA